LAIVIEPKGVVSEYVAAAFGDVTLTDNQVLDL
jgi:hypothetical protein